MQIVNAARFILEKKQLSGICAPTFHICPKVWILGRKNVYSRDGWNADKNQKLSEKQGTCQGVSNLYDYFIKKRAGVAYK